MDRFGNCYLPFRTKILEAGGGQNTALYPVSHSSDPKCLAQHAPGTKVLTFVC